MKLLGTISHFSILSLSVPNIFKNKGGKKGALSSSVCLVKAFSMDDSLEIIFVKDVGVLTF